MHLYNLTLQPPTATTQAIVGNFSGARQQEIIVSHGTRLELLRPDVATGKVASVVATDVFGSIRSLATFRLTGGTKGAYYFIFAYTKLTIILLQITLSSVRTLGVSSSSTMTPRLALSRNCTRRRMGSPVLGGSYLVSIWP